MYKTLVTDVFFDLDHTLWDFEKNSALAFQKIFLENEVPIEIPTFLEVYVPINFEFWKSYREGKISKEDLRHQRLKNTFDVLGYTISEKLIHKLSNAYIENLPLFNHLFPNTIPILDYLKPNYKLHIITNGFQEVQNKKLQNAKIDQYFNCIINSETAGVKKPNPKIFELALKKANVLPQNSLMIGDSLEADIIGAQSVGFYTLHFNSNLEPNHQYCNVIHDLSEIKSYL